MRGKIIVEYFPRELDDLAKVKDRYVTVRHGTVIRYEIPYEDIQFLWAENSLGCQCAYYLVLINGKVYKYCSGCGWDPSYLARFDSVKDYIDYCKLRKADERWLKRTPALKPKSSRSS